MRTKSTLLGGVAVGVMFAVVATAPVQAKTVKKAAPAASQQEVDELRQQLQALKERLDEQAQINQKAQADVRAAQSDAAAAKADVAKAQSDLRTAQQQIIQTIPAQVDTAVAANKPKTDKIYYKGITITMGGFAEAASIYRDRSETADISSSFSKIPFANDPASHVGETRFTARQSRYSLLAQGDVTKSIQAAFYGEFDFQGAAQTANSNQSNSYQPRIRNLYGTVDWNDIGVHILGGQNWSLLTLQNNGISPRSEVTPPQIDAQYIPGFAWARQPGFRVVKDFNKEWWLGLAVEQAQTTFGGTATSQAGSFGGSLPNGVTYVTSQAPTNGFFNGTNYSLNPAPDVIGKVAWEKKLGDQKVHIEGFGIFRTFIARVNYTTAAQTAYGLTPGKFTNTTTGGGGGGSVAVYDVVPKHLDLQASFFAGEGIGRYGSGGLPDVTIRPNGSLVGIPETMWLAGGTYHANKDWDFYGFYGSEDERSKIYATSTTTAVGYGTLPGSNNSGCVIEGSTTNCSNVTKSISQATGGFWWKFYQGPFGRAQWGVQYSYTERKLFADANGFAPKATNNMVFTSFRFYPF